MFSFLAGIVFLGVSIFMSGLVGSIFASTGVYALLGSLLVVVTLIGGGLYYLIRVRHSFVIIIYIRAATAALSFANFPTSVIEKALSPERIKLEGKLGVDAEILAKEIGALILDIKKGINQ